MTTEQQLRAVNLLHSCLGSLEFFAEMYASKVAAQKADIVSKFLQEVKQNGSTDPVSDSTDNS